MTSPPAEKTAADPVSDLAGRGDRLFKSGDHRAALRAYEAALDLNPEAPVSLLAKAALLSRLDRPETAGLYCDRHLELFPRDGEGWKLKGRIEVARREHRKALTAIERALQLLPDDVDLLLFKGYLLADLFGEFERALECYDRALLNRPGDPAIWIRKGRALHNLDQFRPAIACYNRALRLDRENAEAWKDKGDSYNCLALEKKALACYRRAIRLRPRRAAFWHIAALTYDDLGQAGKSRHCYRKVVETGNPEDLEIVNEARIALEDGDGGD